MNAKEFVNYLNGGIELGKLTSFNEEVFKTVQQKLATVKSEDSPESGFCTWLQGVLDTSDEPEVIEKKFLLIQQKLEDVAKNKHMQEYYEADVTTSNRVFTLGGNGRKC